MVLHRKSLAQSAIGVAVVLLASAVKAYAQLPTATVVELEGATAIRLNDSGEIAGALSVGSDEHGTEAHAHAAIYREGAWHDLGVPPGDESSAATAINSLGAIAGFSFYSSGPPYPASESRWRAIWAPAASDAVELLTGFPDDPNGLAPDSFATAINDSGAIVGCLNRNDEIYPDPHRAFLVESGSVTDLHDQLLQPDVDTGYDYSCASDISNAGEIVGYVQTLFAESRAFHLRNGVVTRLEQGPDRMVDAKAINESGQIVGAGILAGFTGLHAVLYDIGTSSLSALGLESSGAYASYPYDINDLGDVVGEMYFQEGTSTTRHAFLATGGQVVDLNELLPDDSPWVLLHAASINRQGDIIGSGYLQSSPNEVRYFRLTVPYDPQARGAALIEAIETLNESGVLNGGNTNALIVKLEKAIGELLGGNVDAAVADLEAFIAQVEALMRAGKLTAAQGRQLIAGALRIIAEITS